MYDGSERLRERSHKSNYEACLEELSGDAEPTLQNVTPPSSLRAWRSSGVDRAYGVWGGGMSWAGQNILGRWMEGCVYVCMYDGWVNGRKEGWMEVQGRGLNRSGQIWHVRRPESSGMALRGERTSPVRRPRETTERSRAQLACPHQQK
jgi:hypothetical protein